MDVVDYLMAIIWFCGAIYLTWMGLSMVASKKYRNDTTRMWFRIVSDAQEKRLRRFVQFFEKRSQMDLSPGL